MRKLQVVGTIVALLLVVIGMNTVADMRQQKAKAQAKEVQKAREAAEAAASAAKGKTTETTGHGTTPAFELPANSGPVTAPVKVESFVNDTNSCHQASTSLKEIQDAYGALVRLEWFSMNDPKVAERSDKLEIGCEAGLVINGKIEMELEKNGGKVLMSFRGPAGDHYKMSDVYRAINQALEAKGKHPPADALAKAEL
ncbi:MAG: hypothetical protein KKI08_26200 [Armatimonadetes bacterium]|nr:hypothetical protein [Armatimonadota bacterium]